MKARAARAAAHTVTLNDMHTNDGDDINFFNTNMRPTHVTNYNAVIYHVSLPSLVILYKIIQIKNI